MTRIDDRLKRPFLALIAPTLMMAPSLLCLPAWSQSAPAAAATTYPALQCNTLQETAVQGKTAILIKVNQTLMNSIITRGFDRDAEIYIGMTAWYAQDPLENLYQNIYQATGRWLSEHVDRWTATTGQFFIFLTLIFLIIVDANRLLLAKASGRSSLPRLRLLIWAAILHGIGWSLSLVTR